MIARRGMSHDRSMRLRTIAPDIEALLSATAPDACRRAAVAAAEAALAASDLREPVLDLLLERLKAGQVIEPDQRDAAWRVVESLDAVQWALQDRIDAGEALEEGHLGAFAQARAAAAALAAADADPSAAALEAAYEAAFAFENRAALWARIKAAAGDPPER